RYASAFAIPENLDMGCRRFLHCGYLMSDMKGRYCYPILSCLLRLFDKRACRDVIREITSYRTVLRLCLCRLLPWLHALWTHVVADALALNFGSSRHS